MYELIKQLCKEKGLSITKLSEMVTESSGNLSTWKKGYMRSDYLSKVADILEVSTDYLLGRTDQPNGYNNNQIHNSDNVALGENAQVHINNTPAENNDEMTSELIKRFKNLSFDEKIEVFNYIKNIK